MKTIVLQPISTDAFAPYGTLIQAIGESEPINAGTTQKYSDVAQVELDPGATASMHIYRPMTIALPHQLQMLERHPLASQAFIPLGRARFVVAVCAEEHPGADDMAAFITDGSQGVQFAKGVWHHPFLALDRSDFLIVDRYCEDQDAAERNLELISIEDWRLTISPRAS